MFITSEQEKFLKFLGKGSNKIERDRALAIITEMREDAGWLNFEDITGRTPTALMGALAISVEEATKLHAAASAILPPADPTPPPTPAPPASTSVILEMPGSIRCGTCSHQLLPNAEFCTRCGTPVASKLVCVQCGYVGAAGEAFCRRDGKQMFPRLEALCLLELMKSENMSLKEARTELASMDEVHRGKLAERAVQTGGGLQGDQLFRGQE